MQRWSSSYVQPGDEINRNDDKEDHVGEDVDRACIESGHKIVFLSSPEHRTELRRALGIL